ncbi:MAG: VCBS repeat-containing protein, partial [Phycisphaerae bacterium]|nr:VCBS repeat-containing protein [Phycisphaerae bacterium]
KDINGDGLVDLLALVQRDNKAFIYIQNGSGLPSAPTQSIELPEGTAWITLYDINEQPGREMLISTAEGLIYFRQNNGIFEMKPGKLIEARQVFGDAPRPFVIEPNRWPDDLKNTIPVVFSDHTMIYKTDENYQLSLVEKIEHKFKNTMGKFNWNSWDIGAGETEQIRIKTIAQSKSEDSEPKKPEQENDYIKNMVEKVSEKEMQRCCIVKEDINGDGNEDVVLLHLVQDVDVKTNIIIFLRQKDGEPAEKPSQVLRCRGIPVKGDYPGPSHFSPFVDINKDGYPEIVMIELKDRLLSASSLVEAIVSKGLDWILTIRQFKKGKGYSNQADFKMDVTTMLPISEQFADSINFDGDFNADGRPDLIIRRDLTQYNIYLSSLATGFYERESKLQLEVPAEGRMSVEDLNSDGISDIYLVDYEKGRVAVFLSESSRKKGPLQ